jgi:hypothetical protein
MNDLYGPKIMAGLRAFQAVADHRYEEGPAGYWFADAVLIREGYPEKVAASILDRLARLDFIEWGVSMRTGWLTERGQAVLAGHAPRREPDAIDRAMGALR